MPPTQRTHNTTHNCASSRFNQQNVWGFFFLLDFAAHFHIQLVAWRTLRLHREINCRDERRKSYTLRLRHQQQIIHDHYPVVATKTNRIRSLNYIFLLDISTQYTTKTNSRASEHTHTHPKSTSSRSTTNQTPNSESLHHAEPILEILKRNPVDKRCVPSPHLVFSTSLKQQKNAIANTSIQTNCTTCFIRLWLCAYSKWDFFYSMSFLVLHTLSFHNS